MVKNLDMLSCIKDNELLPILLELGIKECDALIVTDGSGTTWENACGWAAIVVDLKTNERKFLEGAANFGTSYLAEVIPYVHALSWYIEGPGGKLLKAKLKLRATDKVIIHAITDNQTVARQGERLIGRKTGNYYWAMLDAIADMGYEIRWHWVDRSRLGLNRLADHMAGRCRLAMKAIGEVTLPSGINEQCDSFAIKHD